jgi:5'-3' exoribonuclease 2
MKTETVSKEIDVVKVKEELKKRIKEKESQHLDHCKETIQDTVKLHEAGWKDRYYGDKYKKESIEAGGGLENMRREYVKGLCWVLKYYYEGCPSWNWYYPFHYAPFASDLVNIDSYQFDFDMSQPFRPVEQLLAVLPADSVHALPDPCQWLMTDSESPIFDLYGFDAPIDPNGKHLPWLWILLLPFIDESRISAAFNMCKDTLTLEDRRRNRRGSNIVFAHRKYPLAIHYLASDKHYRPGKETDEEMIEILNKKKQSVIMNDYEDNDESISNNNDIDTDDTFFFGAEHGDGICGYISDPPPLIYAPLDKSIQAPRRPTGAYEDIPCNNVLCFTFKFPESREHSSKLLAGLELPPPALTKYDLVPRS